jgi:hypothetical protein
MNNKEDPKNLFAATHQKNIQTQKVLFHTFYARWAGKDWVGRYSDRYQD